MLVNSVVDFYGIAEEVEWKTTIANLELQFNQSRDVLHFDFLSINRGTVRDEAHSSPPKFTIYALGDRQPCDDFDLLIQ